MSAGVGKAPESATADDVRLQQNRMGGISRRVLPQIDSRSRRARLCLAHGVLRLDDLPYFSRLERARRAVGTDRASPSRRPDGRPGADPHELSHRQYEQDQHQHPARVRREISRPDDDPATQCGWRQRCARLSGLSTTLDANGKVSEVEGSWGRGRADKRITPLRIDSLP